jgi:hypothetical protein
MPYLGETNQVWELQSLSFVATAAKLKLEIMCNIPSAEQSKHRNKYVTMAIDGIQITGEGCPSPKTAPTGPAPSPAAWIPFGEMTASQSSTYPGGQANKCLTDTPRTSWPGTCTHTQSNNKAWWQVTLKSPVAVKQVKLTNRAGCCPNRLQDMDLLVDGVRCNGVNVASGGTSTIPCVATGQVVKVQHKNSNYLTICGFGLYAGKGSSKAECNVPFKVSAGFGTLKGVWTGGCPGNCDISRVAKDTDGKYVAGVKHAQYWKMSKFNVDGTRVAKSGKYTKSGVPASADAMLQEYKKGTPAYDNYQFAKGAAFDLCAKA